MTRNQIFLTALLAIVILCGCVRIACASDVATSAYEKGKALADRKQWQESLKYLNEAIIANPKYALAIKQRSLVHDALGHHLLALQDIARAGEIDPALEPEWHLSGRAAPWMDQQGVDSSLRALKVNANDVSALQSLASSYLAVASHLKMYYPQDKADWFPQYQLAVDAGSRGLDALKAKRVKEAYSILPFYNLRARGLRALGKTDEAIADYTSAIELMPRKSLRDFANVASLYGDRAELHAKQSEIDKAIDDYTTIIDMKPPEPLDREVYYIARAELWVKKNEPSKSTKDLHAAIDSYTQRISTTPYPWIYELRADVYAQLNEYEKAVQDMRLVVTKEPTSGRRDKLSKFAKKLKERLQP